MTDKNNNEPFFARFLEGQFPNVDTGVRAGDGHGSGHRQGQVMITMKYPSDDDEAITMKYPSDSDEA